MKPIVAKAGIIQKYTSEKAMMGSKANSKRNSMYPTFSQKSLFLFLIVVRGLDKINLRTACEKCFSFLIVVRRQILKTVFADKSALMWNFQHLPSGFILLLKCSICVFWAFQETSRRKLKGS
ncbi:hypothetical protein CLI71_01255 [Prevotella intermedia]|uniref:Uncharacterized protein n=1 Tax=Prevotella intermedia TaxID=28131 RepID=A0A2A6EIL0_PREIN|nr:hypothetical protein CLI71_01255 [Prevotella intermedia]